MAQTKKRRRRKHRGTQGGSIDRKRTARPRSRQEAKARARARPGARFERPPTWRSATNRGIVAAGLFVVLLLLAFRRPVAQALAFGVFMLAFYIPMGYFIDSMIWRRRQRSKMR
ncbi:MAG: hypothetical protein AABM29_02755 [Actinomycetota bacterium]